MFIKYIISFFILILAPKLIAQPIIEKSLLIPDYQAFRINPEYDVLPDFSIQGVVMPSSSFNLTFNNIEQLSNDTLYLIDTIYYFNDQEKNKKFKNYRRIFYYDERSRISSVLAEELVDNQWRAHQKTELFYQTNHKLSHIYYTKYDSIIIYDRITYTYNDSNLVQKEICESQNGNNENWCLIWTKNYFYVEGKIIFLDYTGNNNSSFVRQEYKYNNDLLVESIAYKKEGNLIIPEHKFVYEYNENNQQILDNFYSWDESSWLLESSQNFEYEDGKLVEIKDNVSRYYKKEILYDDKNRITDRVSYSKIIWDSLTTTFSKSHLKYEYNSNGYIISSTDQTIDDEDIVKNNSRVIIERDEFQNVTKVLNEKWFGKNWRVKYEMRIMYRKK